MKGFTSKQEFIRYGHLFALSSLLSSEDFWFNGGLLDACTKKDYEKLRELLVEAVPLLQEFANVIDWRQLAESASKVYEFGRDEHNFLLERLGLITLPSSNIH
jgi:hypothetical protein